MLSTAEYVEEQLRASSPELWYHSNPSSGDDENPVDSEYTLLSDVDNNNDETLETLPQNPNSPSISPEMAASALIELLGIAFTLYGLVYFLKENSHTRKEDLTNCVNCMRYVFSLIMGITAMLSGGVLFMNAKNVRDKEHEARLSENSSVSDGVLTPSRKFSSP